MLGKTGLFLRLDKMYFQILFQCARTTLDHFWKIFPCQQGPG